MSTSRILAIYDILIRAHQIFTSATQLDGFAVPSRSSAVLDRSMYSFFVERPLIVEVLDSIEDGAYA